MESEGGLKVKNREKYKNELMNVIKMDGNTCGFVIKHEVSRMFGTEMESFCGETDCNACGTALQLWLDEEYEVDWDNVPVDTPVLVRNSKNEDWTLRHFKRIRDTAETHKFETWGDRMTSRTTDGIISLWRYCELAEDEDNDE